MHSPSWWPSQEALQQTRTSAEKVIQVPTQNGVLRRLPTEIFLLALPILLLQRCETRSIFFGTFLGMLLSFLFSPLSSLLFSCLSLWMPTQANRAISGQFTSRFVKKGALFSMTVFLLIHPNSDSKKEPSPSLVRITDLFAFEASSQGESRKISQIRYEGAFSAYKTTGPLR